MQIKSLRYLNRRPTHPGAILREDILPALHMTQAEFAKRLGVSRPTVSELLLEKRAVSPEMAIRLAMLLNTTAESWLHMQEAVDLWKVRQQAGKLSNIQPLEKRRLSSSAV